MKKLYFLDYKIEESEALKFENNLIMDNIYRGELLAISIIFLEVILVISDILTLLLKVDNRFHFNAYLLMYLIMICANVIYLVHIKRFKSQKNASIKQYKRMKMGMIVYITFIMTWGSIISMMDQKLYGQLIVFMIMTIISSVLYFMDNVMIAVPYFFSVTTLIIGLPFFQKSTDILIGHYINLCIFVVTSWLASRIIFRSYVSNFNNDYLLQKSKAMLEVEIEEKRMLNDKLMTANMQLKQLALIDELTEIPNRRGFKNYLDIAFENHKGRAFALSVVMIDIDFFKQFNDRYGHDAGDHVLIMVARHVDEMLKREGGFFCRWGGEEFIYLSLYTTEEDIKRLADEIRKQVCELAITNEASMTSRYVTVSAGTCSSVVIHREEVSRLINHADMALYQAKANGRNCIVTYNNDAPLG